MWHVEFYEAREAPIFEVPLARRLLSRGTAHTGAMTRVVFNATFYLLPAYQRSGFARALYDAEATLYRRWGVCEIQLQAQRDGLSVWIKKFGFQPMDPGHVFAAYPSWARRNQLDPEPPSRIQDLPDAYLQTRDQLDLYKVLS